MAASHRALLSWLRFRAQARVNNRSWNLACPLATTLSVRLAQQSALCAAHAGLAVLGWQHCAGALCGRACAAADAVLHPLDRNIPDAVALRPDASGARLADAARTLAASAAAGADRLCRQ